MHINIICKATRINIKSMSIFYSLAYINSQSEKFISEKNISPPKCCFVGAFFLFWKNLHEHQNSENEFSNRKKKIPSNRKSHSLK